VNLSELPRDLTFYDIMGNPLPEGPLMLTDSVVYFRGRMGPDKCIKSFKGTRAAK